MKRVKLILLTLILGSAVLVGGREAQAVPEGQTYCYLPYPVVRTVGGIPQFGYAYKCSDQLGNVTTYYNWL
jgi:hypothetical protein